MYKPEEKSHLRSRIVQKKDDQIETARRVVEVTSPQRPSLRERVRRAERALEAAALDRLRRDVLRRRT